MFPIQLPIYLSCSFLSTVLCSMQGCGIAMPASSDLYIELAGQVDFPS